MSQLLNKILNIKPFPNGKVHRHPFGNLRNGIYELEQNDGSLPQRLEIKDNYIRLSPTLIGLFPNDLPATSILTEIQVQEPITEESKVSIASALRKDLKAKGAIHSFPYHNIPGGLYDVIGTVFNRSNFRVLIEGDRVIYGEQTSPCRIEHFPHDVRLQAVF